MKKLLCVLIIVFSLIGFSFATEMKTLLYNDVVLTVPEDMPDLWLVDKWVGQGIILEENDLSTKLIAMWVGVNPSIETHSISVVFYIDRNVKKAFPIFVVSKSQLGEFVWGDSGLLRQLPLTSTLVLCEGFLDWTYLLEDTEKIKETWSGQSKVSKVSSSWKKRKEQSTKTEETPKTY